MFKVNEYFDGKVKLIVFQILILLVIVGVISLGEYEFGISKKEIMIVISGVFIVLLFGVDEWMIYGVGESFDVVGQVSFKVKIDIDIVYFCIYE